MKNESAAALDRWFRSGFAAFVEAFSSITDDPERRDAIFREVLARNAPKLVDAALDRRGELFAPTLLALGAACRLEGVLPDERNWGEALDAVVKSESQSIAASMFVFVRTGAAIVFKTELAQALLNAGVAGVPTMLDQDGQALALRVAIHAGMRFLIAYAREATEAADPAFLRLKTLAVA